MQHWKSWGSTLALFSHWRNCSRPGGALLVQSCQPGEGVMQFKCSYSFYLSNVVLLGLCGSEVCFSFTSGSWDFHSGDQSVDSCQLVFLGRELELRRICLTILMTYCSAHQSFGVASVHFRMQPNNQVCFAHLSCSNLELVVVTEQRLETNYSFVKVKNKIVSSKF